MEMFEEYTVFERKLIKLYSRKRKREFFFNQKQTIQSTLLSKEPQQVFQETQKFYTNYLS